MEALKQSFINELAELDRRHELIDNQLVALLESKSEADNTSLNIFEHFLSKIDKISSDFSILQSASTALCIQISDGNTTAERVSSAVRQIDMQRSHAQQALLQVEEAEELRGCVVRVREAKRDGDLRKAVHQVCRFHQLDASVLAGSAELIEMKEMQERLKSEVFERFRIAIDRKLENDLALVCPLLGPLGLAWEANDLYLSYAQGCLETRLEEYDQPKEKYPATQSISMLYNICAAFLQEQVPLVKSGLASSCGDVLLVRMVHSEGGARAAAAMRAYIRDNRVKKQVSEVISALNRDHVGGGSTKGSSGSNLPSNSTGTTSTFSSARMSEIDNRLDELALLLQHSESYDRFICHIIEGIEKEHPKVGDKRSKESFPGAAGVLDGPVLPERTSLEEAVGEVSALYSELEGSLFRCSLEKAIYIDQIRKGSPTSSCIEDAFFVAQRCAKRAFATGQALVASAVVNHIANALSGDFLENLLAEVRGSLGTLPGIGNAGIGIDVALRQLGQIDFTDFGSLKGQFQDNLQEVGQGLASDLTSLGASALSGHIAFRPPADGRVPTSLPSPDQQKCLVYLNNLEACVQCILRLGAEFSIDVSETFQEGRGAHMLLATISNFKGCSESFEQALATGLEEVVARLRPMIRLMVSEKIGDKSQISYKLSENEYVYNEVSDSWALDLANVLLSLLYPYEPPHGLSSGMFARLFALVCECVAHRVEAALKRKRFTQLGGLQLDKDVRTLCSIAAKKAGPNLRSPFSRLQQISLLLSSDDIDDVVDFWSSNGVLKQIFSARDIREILALREDFPLQSISALKL